MKRVVLFACSAGCFGIWEGGGGGAPHPSIIVSLLLCLNYFSHTIRPPRLFARNGVSSGIVCENTRLLLRSKSKYTLQMVGMPNCPKKNKNKIEP